MRVVYLARMSLNERTKQETYTYISPGCEVYTLKKTTVGYWPPSFVLSFASPHPKQQQQPGPPQPYVHPPQQYQPAQQQPAQGSPRQTEYVTLSPEKGEEYVRGFNALREDKQQHQELREKGTGVFILDTEGKEERFIVKMQSPLFKGWRAFVEPLVSYL